MVPTPCCDYHLLSLWNLPVWHRGGSGAGDVSGKQDVSVPGMGPPAPSHPAPISSSLLHTSLCVK